MRTAPGQPLCLSLLAAATWLAGACAAQQSATPIQWTSLGPTAIPGASGTVGSGKIQAIAVYAANPLIMYAGGGVGSGTESPNTAAGAFKSTDGGAHWTPVNNGLTDAFVDAIWVDPTNPDNVLIGSEVGGISHSTDGGQSWNPAGVPVQPGPDSGPPQGHPNV